MFAFKLSTRRQYWGTEKGNSHLRSSLFSLPPLLAPGLDCKTVVVFFFSNRKSVERSVRRALESHASRTRKRASLSSLASLQTFCLTVRVVLEYAKTRTVFQPRPGLIMIETSNSGVMLKVGLVKNDHSRE